MVLFLLFIFPALLQPQTVTTKTIFFLFKIGNMFGVKGIIPGGLRSGACGLQVYMCRL